MIVFHKYNNVITNYYGFLACIYSKIVAMYNQQQ